MTQLKFLAAMGILVRYTLMFKPKLAHENISQKWLKKIGCIKCVLYFDFLVIELYCVCVFYFVKMWVCLCAYLCYILCMYMLACIVCLCVSVTAVNASVTCHVTVENMLTCICDVSVMK